VASLVFKTMDTLKRRVVGSIPIHLRQARPAIPLPPWLDTADFPEPTAQRRSLAVRPLRRERNKPW